jgi:hypothetical protein
MHFVNCEKIHIRIAFLPEHPREFVLAFGESLKLTPPIANSAVGVYYGAISVVERETTKLDG